MSIFSGSASKKLAGKIAKNLGLELSPVEIFVFSRMAKNGSELRKMWLVRLHHYPVCQHPTHENYMEPFIMIDALKTLAQYRLKPSFHIWVTKDRTIFPRRGSGIVRSNCRNFNPGWNDRLFSF